MSKIDVNYCQEATIQIMGKSKYETSSESLRYKILYISLSFAPILRNPEIISLKSIIYEAIVKFKTLSI